MWPPQSVNTWPTPAPLSVRATSSPPVIQSEGAAPSEPPRLSSRQPPRFTCGSHDQIHRLASAGGAPAPQRPAARTTRSTDSLRPAGPQPRDGLRLALPHPKTRLGRRGPSPATACGSHDQIHRLASAGGAPAPRRPAARTTTSTDSPRPAGPPPPDGLRLAPPHPQTPPRPPGPRPPTAPRPPPPTPPPPPPP